MRSIITIIFSFLIGIGSSGLQAQEFECSCNVKVPTLQTADPEVFEDLENRMTEFFNKTVWTSDRYQPEERIKCSITLNITQELSNTSFAGELIINASRPVFSSNYETPVFTYSDKNISFDFQALQPIVFSENSFTDNLSSTLMYYGYLMLAMDYDTYSPYGGEQYITEAQNVINNVPQQLQSSNWGNVTDNSLNRVTIVESMLSPRMRALRKAYYDYHRTGLDVMADKSDEGRQVILNSLNTFGTIGAKLNDEPYIRIFSVTKKSEIIGVFSQGARPQKLKAYDVMIKIDPANASDYSVIKR